MNYKAYWNKAIVYSAYIQMIDALLEEGKTTGPNQTEALSEYTDLNAKRMARLSKTYQPSKTLIETMGQQKGLLILVITEAWCGDAAQIAPIIAKAGEAAEVPVKMILRDEHPELIDAHLTNGGRSIPIVLFIDEDKWEVNASWGPRPEPAQQLVIAYKRADEPKPPYAEFVKQVQLWYAKDKQKSMEAEWIALLT